MPAINALWANGHHLRRRHNRLPADCYLAPSIVHFTICTAGRQPLFRDGATVAEARRLLYAASVEPLQLEAFCFMPDHLHVLISTPGGTDTRSAIIRFKQVTGYAYRRRTNSSQAGFHDRILRRDEDLVATIRYIVANPIRRGWCEDWTEWPWSWSRWPIEE